MFKNNLLNGSGSLNELIKAETRLVIESEAVLDKALSDITAMKPDVLLHCGDMTSNGEHVCMELIKDKLDGVSAKLPDTKICVVNGNHDINNSFAADFSSGKPAAAMTKDQNVSEDRELHIRNKLIYCAEDQKAAGIYAWYKDKLPISLRTTYLNLKSGVNSVWYEENNDDQTDSKLFIWDSISGMKPLYAAQASDNH